LLKRKKQTSRNEGKLNYRICSWLPALRATLCKDPRFSLLQGEEVEVSEGLHCVSKMTGVDVQQVAREAGRLKANTFRRGLGRCLLPAISMVNHSCTPNCRVQWGEGGIEMVLRTRVALHKGDQITISYCSAVLGTPARQKKLQTSKGFVCGCERCCDPEEKGSLMGAIVCTKCRKSHLIPHLESGNNNRAHLLWKCSCGFEANTEKVENFLAKLDGELEMLERLEVSDRDVSPEKSSPSWGAALTAANAASLSE